MQKIFSAIILLFLSFHCFSQDVILKTSGTKVKCKVLEINTNSVKYKTDDRIYEMDKNEIQSIVYENGTKEFYNKPEPSTTNDYVETKNQKSKKKKPVFKNIMAINCFEMLFSNFSMSYERIFDNPKLSIKIPISVGLQGRPNTTNYTSQFGTTQFLLNRIFASGVELNIYPAGQTQHTFYIGLSTLAGNFKYYKSTNSAFYPYTKTTTEYEGMHYSLMLHLGGYIGISENFLLGTKMGLGYKREDTIEEDFTIPTAEFDFNIAYRF